MPLSARDLTLAYGHKPVVSTLDLGVAAHRVTAFVDANPSGRSTLLMSAGPAARAARMGTVRLDGREIARMRTREVARRVAILLQGPAPPYGLTR